MTFYKDKRFGKNKAGEIQIDLLNPLKNGCSFEINVRPSWKTDHAGLSFSISAFGIYFNLSFYDVRHWDEKTNTYKTYN